MVYNFNEDYQYDACSSRGICSINPKTSFLQEILVMYLKTAAFLALRVFDAQKNDKEIRSVILDTISVMVANPEFSEADFKELVSRFNKIIPHYADEYGSDSKDLLKTFTKSSKETSLTDYIQLGKKEFLKNSKSLSQNIGDLYKILFVIAKSICINVVDLESFGINANEGYLAILKILNLLNNDENDCQDLKKFTLEVSEIDNLLMKQLRAVQEKRYGMQQIKEVSYSTTKGKAVLVAGSNIRELENILEALSEENIDVYTHDEMVIANTFPKFDEYKNLKGQFGQGVENCLLDFATFPGPVILTAHSLYNVENLYRGRLYTTDFAHLKGVIPIENKDFSGVIKAAEESKGFKTGRQCESVSIGFNYEDFIKTLKAKSGLYSGIVLIGLGAYTLEQQTYFAKFLKQAPENLLIVSLSFCTEKENVICLNAYFDSYAVIKVFEGIRKTLPDSPLTLIYPHCDRHTMPQMLYFSKEKNTKIFVGKCTPVILNPNLTVTLHDVFGINSLSSVKKDLEKINE